MMHKCPKCGTEFEGNFCPECGEKFVEEKNCPNCGATLPGNAKFCNACGYSFYDKPAAPHPVKPVKQEKALTVGTTILHTAVSVLPTVMFVLFSVLLFLIFLAPVAVVPDLMLFGEIIPGENCGNVYALTEYKELSMMGSLAALIAFAALSLAIALVLAFLCVFSKSYYKRVSVAGKKIFVRSILTAVGYALFFALFLISCILFGQISEYDSGLGILKVGAAPVLVLVFTLVSMVISAGCVFVGAYLRKRYPAIVQEWEEKIAAAKPTAVESRLKKHKKLAVTCTSAVLVVAIAVGIAVPVGIANRHNGTYYAYDKMDEYDEEQYFKLKGSKWEDETGMTGKISFDGENVTLTITSSDLEKVLGNSPMGIKGTINDDILKIGKAVYAKKGHKHSQANGTCACGRCFLGISVNADKSYTITGKGSFKGTKLIIPDSATRIGSCAFENCSSLTQVTIPDSVTSIENHAFSQCSALKSIQFKGTVEQWKAIEKESDWDESTGSYTVTCTDGTVKRSNVVGEEVVMYFR